MEKMQWENVNISNKQILIHEFIKVVAVLFILIGIGVPIYMYSKSEEIRNIMWYPLISFPVSIIFFVCLKFTGFNQAKNDKESLLAKKGFNPSFISSHFQNPWLALDETSFELCVSERKEPNLYDVSYFEMKDLKYHIIIDRKISREVIKTESASYGKKVTGALVGGLVGTLVADAVGAKYEKGKQIINVQKVTLLIASLNEPNQKFEFEIYNDYFGSEDKKLRENYPQYQEALDIKYKINNCSDNLDNIRIIKNDTVEK